MSNILDNYIISRVPMGGDHDSDHIRNGNKVAITETGLSEHNVHNLVNRVGIMAGAAAVLTPVVIGGGIGVAVGGEAFGVGVLEQIITGGATGGFVGKGTHKGRRGYLRDDKHPTMTLVDMIGTVVTKRARWWDQPGQDVKVKWTGADEYGNRTTFTSWHNPDHLVTVRKKK
jgi:hypothetical protein